MALRRRLLWCFVCNRTFIHIANYRCSFDQWHNRLNAYGEKNICRVHSIRWMPMPLSLPIPMSMQCNLVCYHFFTTSRLIDIHLHYHASIVPWNGNHIDIVWFRCSFHGFTFYIYSTAFVCASVWVCVYKVCSFNVASVNDKIVI